MSDRVFATVLGVMVLGIGVGAGWVVHDKSDEAQPQDVRALLREKTKYLHESHLIRVIDPGTSVRCYVTSSDAISCLPIDLMTQEEGP